MSDYKIKWTDSHEPVEETKTVPLYDNVNIAPKCVIGLDRDGVINVDRGTYTYRPQDFEPIEGSLHAITKLRYLGHKIVIITNQGGISKGLYTSQDVEAVHNHMFDLLAQSGCPSIDALFYSESSMRSDMYAKPNTGMFKRCENEVKHIKFKQGYYVGDKISDLKAAFKMGARPVLVRTGYGEQTIKELNKFTNQKIKKKTIIFDDLLSFANWIESKQ